MHNLGAQALDLGDFAQARTRFEHCIAIAREVGAPRLEIRALNCLGQMQRVQLDSVAAMHQLEEVLALAHAQHQDWLLPSILGGLGLTSTDLGDLGGQERSFTNHSPWQQAKETSVTSSTASKGWRGSPPSAVRRIWPYGCLARAQAMREELAFPLSPTEICLRCTDHDRATSGAGDR